METASQKAKQNYIFNTENCWIITEGMIGTENQCIGIAENLGLTSAVIKRIGLKWPFTWLCPSIKYIPQWAFKGDDINAPFPDLVIASGRKAIAASLFIKKHSHGKTFTVQVQDPRIDPRYFDLVAVPQHDPTRGENVIVTKGAPNRMTQEKLNAAYTEFADDLSHLPAKRIALLIGGNSKAHQFTIDNARTLFAQLLPLLQSGEYGFMITVSRRTPPDIAQYLRDRLNTPHCVFWDGEGVNPYFGFLAHATYIIVTEDSVSMISDAATTGKPVYIIPLTGGKKRFNRFKQALLQDGVIRVFDGRTDHWTYDAFNDSAMVADEIKKRFANRGQSL